MYVCVSLYVLVCMSPCLCVYTGMFMCVYVRMFVCVQSRRAVTGLRIEKMMKVFVNLIMISGNLRSQVDSLQLLF